MLIIDHMKGHLRRKCVW